MGDSLMDIANYFNSKAEEDYIRVGDPKAVDKLIEKKKTIGTMESCTGGGIADAITSVEGASLVLKFSAVTYSNEYKIKMGVKEETIEKYRTL